MSVQDDFRPELDDSDELTPETLAAVEEGLNDLRHDRAITLEEYRRTRGL
jgi:hypothetical protein